MRRPVVAALLALTVSAVVWGIFRRYDGGELFSFEALKTTSLADAVPAGESVSAPKGVQSLRFTRLIHAKMGSQALATLHLSGTIWTQSSGGELQNIVVKIEALEASEGKTTDFPLVRIDLPNAQNAGLKFKLATLPGAVPVTDDTAQAAVRFARDMLDQLRFFETSDLQGAYEAHIMRRDAHYFRKAKLKYVDGPYAAASILVSRHALTLAQNGLFEKVEGVESISMGTDRLAVASETSYRIWVDSSPGATLAATQAWADFADFKHESVATRSPRRGLRLDADALARAPALTDLLVTLRSGSLKSGAEQLGWFRNTVRRLDVESGRLTQVRDLIRELRANSEELKLLVGALASSGQADAGPVLLEAYRNDTYSSEQHQMIMNSWIVTDVRLPAETTAFLLQVAADSTLPADQTQSAMLALGAQVLKADGQTGAQQAQIKGLLIAKLSSSQTETDTVGALDAMGNSGAEDFLPYIRPYITAATAHVRAHAYLALRLIPDPKVAALLATGHADPSGEVQSSVELSLNLRLSSL